MPVTYTTATGGNVTTGGTTNGNTLVAGRQPFVEWGFTLPDSYPGNITFYGVLVPVNADGGSLGTPLAFSVTGGGSLSLALPSVPAGTGAVTYWALSIVLATGVVSLVTSTTAALTAAAGSLILAQGQVNHGDSVPWAANAGVVAPTITDLN